MRVFDRLAPNLHQPFVFSIFKRSHGVSTIFDGDVYFAVDKQRIFVEFEAKAECFEGDICVETQNALKEGLNDDNHENMSVYLVLSGTRSRVVASQDIDEGPVMRRAHSISIPDSVEQLCEGCVSVPCYYLSRVTFGTSSSLKCIHDGAFVGSSLSEIHIPDSVEELCNGCFQGCTSLSRVVFGESSSLKRIGKGAFVLARLTEIQIPASVEELGASCFSICTKLSRVAFSKPSSLQRIGSTCFHGCAFSYFFVPATVTSIGGSAFSLCHPHSFVLDEFNLCFSVVGCLLLSKSGQVCYGYVKEVEEVAIPDSVEELCDRCFSGCISLSRIRFGELSSLKRIGVKAFFGTGLKEIHIPDGVEELCDKCFSLSENLLRITFGESSTLKRIGCKTFYSSDLSEIHIPDSVEEICDKCFHSCENLSRVTFGEASTLKRIGYKAFSFCSLAEIQIPDRLASLLKDTGCNAEVQVIRV